MRIYGRQPSNNNQWVCIDTDNGGDQDSVYVLWLIQTLKLNTLESPFYPDQGVPAWQSMQQVFYPDSSIAQIQAQFASYFSYLTISRQNTTDPSYLVKLITINGTQVTFTVAQ